MWYLASLFCLLLMLAVLTAIGTVLADWCLPWRLRPVAREFLAPTLGLALLLVPINLLGWLGQGFRPWVCWALTGMLAAVGFGWQSRHAGLLRRGPWYRLTGFTALASFPMLGQILRFNTFNPFNDAWTYLYQAQWLQHHGFRDPAVIAGHHPAAVAVAGFQLTDLRITPSFLLGWWQATFGLDWSYEAYPATVSLVLVCGALAVGGIVRASFPARRREAWWVALAVAVTLNGFAFGAVEGFLPQTVGLAFSTAALALRGMELAARGSSYHGPMCRGRAAALREMLPLAACVAAVVYCYPELLAFLVPALGVSYVLPWPRNRAEIWFRGLSVVSVAVPTILLASFELRRAFHALKMQTHMVAGNPVPWSAGEFLAQSLGLKSGIYEGGSWIYENGWGILWAGLLPVTCFGILLRWSQNFHSSEGGVRGTRWWLAATPALLMAGLCAAAFGYFRFLVANPWPHGLGPWGPGVGQTWSQFKLSLWVSPALLAVTGVILLRLFQRRHALVVQLLLAAWCAAGLGWNALLLLPRANTMRLVSGEQNDPFGSYRAFCEPLARLPTSDVIFLDAAPGDFGSIKQRELLAYFLGDHQLVGDWTLDDNLTIGYFPPEERKMPVEDADWIVRYHPADADIGADRLPPLCRLTVSHATRLSWMLDAVGGGYAGEHESNGSCFYWTARELHMVWHRARPDRSTVDAIVPPQRMKLTFSQHSFAAEQTITVHLTGPTGTEQTFTVRSSVENRLSESAPFLVSGDEVKVSFVGSGEPSRASAPDPRELSYLIGNAALQLVKD